MTQGVSLLWIVVGIALLMFFNLKFKLHNVISLLVVGIFVAIMEGMPIQGIVETVEQGMGGIFGHLALIIIFGAVVGKIMTDSGASQQIADTIIVKCGTKYLAVGLLVIGVIFGIAMFYEVAFLIAVPLILNIAKKANIPYMRLIIPTVVGATMGHSLFPPQPGPVALVAAFNADISQVYIWGIVVIIPSLICAGIILPRLIPGLNKMPLDSMLKPVDEIPKNQLPSFGTSITIPLIPAILMIISSIVKPVVGKDSVTGHILTFVGSAEISMLIALFAAMILLGFRRGKNMTDMTKTMSQGVAQIADVLIVITAGGILKQVIIDSGVSDHIVNLVSNIPVSPFIIAWIITAIIRILTGQGAVAAITSAGMVAPLVTQFNLNPALMVLAVACGSNTITLMYDGGFLLFKETFGISMKDTFKTWGLLELTNSVVGLLAVLVLSLFI
ncbi:gluconate:H+ symporter [Bacillus cytotoxicus]|uniref:High-affinity gluconate transporter GntP n=1 Tax=Bacillus cytotoxicus TaxID=580165 RepID=A0AAX2CLV3_9BACI|nr:MULTISPECIES: gluconate:H+ symporter [Bacillus cereus group]AWC30243.1 gluconate permease [Bacillus cytotoxicus]AWC42383.1 gluconate permease [Bacillus cytotoxicus]AWC50314.1 gluconate permease [Bacillus cytotoxicus]AWC54369.1 gluconate permease [Bacillus cytotoxicus]AWC58493.1 gluconate permease [Bacillus cytotoxicus]